MRPTTPRPPTAGPNPGPEPPFPLRVEGPVIPGFGRGSKELGIPTANIPVEGLAVGGNESVESGVYYGWCGLGPVPKDGVKEKGGEEEGGTNGDKGKEGAEGVEGVEGVYPMVMSIGWNPYYKNTVRSVEVHILHSFPSDFYGAHLKLLILGYIRPEYDYVSKEALIEDIELDIQVAKRSLEREGYRKLEEEGWLREF